MRVVAHHTSFPVRDLARSRYFYGTVLGLPPLERPDSFGLKGLWFDAGPTQVHLIEVPEGFDVGQPPATVNPAARHAAFAVPDYDRAVAHLKAHGLAVVETNAEYGQMWVADPDGHVIELIVAR